MLSRAIKCAVGVIFVDHVGCQSVMYRKKMGIEMSGNKKSVKLTGYAHLVALLRSLEEDIGLVELSPLERNIVATLSLEEFRSGASSDDMMNHALLDRPTTSSFYRALKRLRLHNMVSVVGDRKTGRYTLSNQLG
jgi:hypothetical protein